ncbi:hypothetical protein ACFY1L_21330 [Streptomyces sp. NPDC001663]|uniref:hypothetical protein n=1 Tax=Streptomyces sp. NPDC001663 TaxID=3364597 RepID=UPI0036802D74
MEAQDAEFGHRTVNGREKSESFITKGLAESRRAKLMTAARDGEPFDSQTGLPASEYHAAFSGPYTVAAALLGGAFGVYHEDFTDAADERCSASFPHAFPAVLRVTTRAGGTRGPRRGANARPS